MERISPCNSNRAPETWRCCSRDDGIKTDFLRTAAHADGGVIGLIERAESGRKRADSLVALHLQIRI